jgi:hypothetical protein
MKILKMFFLLPVIMFNLAQARDIPRTIAYSAQPNSYFNDHAADVAKILDGFFFVSGSWDESVVANLGLEDGPPAVNDWKEKVRDNLIHLRQTGVTENSLGVSFSDSAPWPSAETLLSEEYCSKFSKHFAAIGRAAKELGFIGVSIDVEYPYPRYQLDHKIYTYEGYTAEDLLAAAARQGRAAMTALLEEFPEAVIFLLPGDLWGRSIERAFVFAMLDVMAERDAPGGLHLAFERSYCLLDPVSQVAIPRVGDCAAEHLVEGKALDYWKRRCTVAPGVWPLHQVETGGLDYPKRPWSEELAELRQQMRTLRTVAKKYIWTFSGHPAWYPYSSELVSQYGLPKQDFEGAEEAITGWHDILSEKKPTDDPKLLKLIGEVEKFDRGEIDAAKLCTRFGTPGEWAMLGPLGNPFAGAAFSAPTAALPPIRFDRPIAGRDGAVRWFPFRNLDPLGSVHLRAALEWLRTDDCSAQLVTWITSKEETHGFLNMGWDDGVEVRLGGEVVFDRREYEKGGHGLLYLDRYDFEERVPVTIPKGSTRLAVTSINSHGGWGVNIRLTDAEGFPLEGVKFNLINE